MTEQQIFKITVCGSSTHGATPHLGQDAIVASSAIIQALQTIISRDTDPLKELSVVVGGVHSGTQFNIVAGTAELEGSVLAADKSTLTAAMEDIRRIAAQTAEAMKCTAAVEFTDKTEERGTL